MPRIARAHPGSCQKVQEETASEERRKRNRPSYLSHFPPLNEFNDSSSSEVEQTKSSSRRVSNDNAGVTATTQMPSCTQPTTLVPSNKAPPQSPPPPLSQPQESQTGPEVAKTQSRRCNRCILQRRKCDGVQPKCGLCTERGSECIYNKASITRAYLEQIQRGAEDLRRASMNVEVTAEARTIASSLSTPAKSERDEVLRRLKLQTGPALRMNGNAAEWSTREYVAFMRAMDLGVKVDDGGLFDRTTQMLDAFRREEGSIADEWARETCEGVKLKWEETNWERPYAQEGLTENLRRRSGLLGTRRYTG